jgi:outer membrane lipoprotein SlyB
MAVSALAALLVGCAARPIPPPAAQTYSLPGKYRPGVVVAVRQVDIARADPSRAGVNAVLAALNQGAPAGAIAAQEVVIRRDDGSATTVVEPAGTNETFAVGDNVAIADGPLAALVHRN